MWDTNEDNIRTYKKEMNNLIIDSFEFFHDNKFPSNMIGNSESYLYGVGWKERLQTKTLSKYKSMMSRSGNFGLTHIVRW
jgi:hypothetical protein